MDFSSLQDQFQSDLFGSCDSASKKETFKFSSAPQTGSSFTEILQNLNGGNGSSTPHKLRSAWDMASSSRAVKKVIGPPIREPLAPIKSKLTQPAWRSPLGASQSGNRTPVGNRTPGKAIEAGQHAGELAEFDVFGGKENSPPLQPFSEVQTPVRARWPQAGSAIKPMSTGGGSHRTLRKQKDYTSSLEGLYGGAVRIAFSAEKAKKRPASGSKKASKRSYMDSTAASRAQIYTPMATTFKELSHAVKHPQKRKASSSKKPKAAISPGIFRSGGKKKKRMRIQRFSKVGLKLETQDRRSSSSFHELFLEKKIGIRSPFTAKEYDKEQNNTFSSDEIDDVKESQSQESPRGSQESPIANVREVALGVEECKATPLLQENLKCEFDNEMRPEETQFEADALFMSLQRMQISNSASMKKGSHRSKYLTLNNSPNRSPGMLMSPTYANKCQDNQGLVGCCVSAHDASSPLQKPNPCTPQKLKNN